MQRIDPDKSFIAANYYYLSWRNGNEIGVSHWNLRAIAEPEDKRLGIFINALSN